MTCSSDTNAVDSPDILEGIRREFFDCHEEDEWLLPYASKFDQLWDEVMESSPQEVAHMLADLDGKRQAAAAPSNSSRGPRFRFIRRLGAAVRPLAVQGARGLSILAGRLIRSDAGSSWAWARPALVSAVVLLIGFGLGDRVGASRARTEAALPSPGGSAQLAEQAPARLQFAAQHNRGWTRTLVLPEITVIASSNAASTQSAAQLYRLADGSLLVGAEPGPDASPPPADGREGLAPESSGNDNEITARARLTGPAAIAGQYSRVVLAINCVDASYGGCVVPQGVPASIVRPVDLGPNLVAELQGWYARSPAYGSEVVCVIGPPQSTVECSQPQPTTSWQFGIHPTQIASGGGDWWTLLMFPEEPTNP